MKPRAPAFFFMSVKRKIVFVLVIAGQVLSTLFDLVSLSLVAPFVFLASDPTMVERNRALKVASQFLGIHDIHAFIQVLGFGILVFLVLSGLFKVVANQGSLRFARSTTIELSHRQLRTILNLQLRHFERIGSSQLRFIILSDLQLAVNGVLVPTIDLLSKSIVSLIFLVGMVTINPLVVFVLLVGFVSFYGTVFLLQKGRLHGYGTKVRQTSKGISRQVADMVESVREIKVYGGQKTQSDEMREQQEHLAAMQYRSAFMGTIPRISLETVILGLIVIFLLSNLTNGTLKEILPLLGIVVVVFFRLSGIFQGIFTSFSKIRMNLASYREFRRRVIELSVPEMQEGLSSDEPERRFHESLELRGVSFSYEPDQPVLKEVDLTVKRGQWVGITGGSGSGKSTLLDVVSGLLRPDTGEVSIDGVAVSQGTELWRGGQMAFATQSCVLIEKSIAENIAFGVARSDINQERLRWAARVAEVADYIEETCPNGYETVLAEAGLKPSGGQKQRLSLARALYHRSRVLILDEVTSALDLPTEEKVLANLRSLDYQPTVITVSHKPAILRVCDQIVVLDQGRIVDRGTWDDLVERNQSIRDLAGAAPTPSAGEES